MAFNNQAYENGNAFSHKDGKLIIGGFELPSCTDFKIGVTSTVTQNAGMGGAPVSFGTESAVTEGSFTIDQKDLIKLSALSPTGMLPRAIAVPGFFLQENEVGNKTGLAWTHTKFENDGVETSTGNTQTVITINFKCVNLIRLTF